MDAKEYLNDFIEYLENKKQEEPRIIEFAETVVNQGYAIMPRELELAAVKVLPQYELFIVKEYTDEVLETLRGANENNLVVKFDSNILINDLMAKKIENFVRSKARKVKEEMKHEREIRSKASSKTRKRKKQAKKSRKANRK